MTEFHAAHELPEVLLGNDRVHGAPPVEHVEELALLTQLQHQNVHLLRAETTQK